MALLPYDDFTLQLLDKGGGTDQKFAEAQISGAKLASLYLLVEIRQPQGIASEIVQAWALDQISIRTRAEPKPGTAWRIEERPYCAFLAEDCALLIGERNAAPLAGVEPPPAGTNTISSLAAHFGSYLRLSRIFATHREFTALREVTRRWSVPIVGPYRHLWKPQTTPYPIDVAHLTTICAGYEASLLKPLRDGVPPAPNQRLPAVGA
jgi:hypothetical protein